MMIPISQTRRRNKRKLFFYALSDKVLVDGRVQYVLYFDGDEEYHGGPTQEFDFHVFQTRNGFHAVSDMLGSAEEKRFWYELWKEYYPDSDYMLGNLNWLAPQSGWEFDFIVKTAMTRPLVSRYYRDKAVFER